jgi:hypothetical protein
MAGGEEALAEVAGHDLVGVADGSEVDAGVPADEYIDVCRYTLKLCGGQESGFLPFTPFRVGMTWIRSGGGPQEWFQQLGDAGRVHGIPDCRWRIVDLGKVEREGELLAAERRKLATDGTCPKVGIGSKRRESLLEILHLNQA